MELLQLLEQNRDYIIEQRRCFHSHPEISWQEENTMVRIEAELDAMGVEHERVPHGGVLGFIHGAGPGKTVLLRADIDALPVQEAAENLKGPKACVSENPGVCHACGHDGHIAGLLGAAKILSENRTGFNGDVVLMFEEAEELMENVLNLQDRIRARGIQVDTAAGLHLYAALDTGKIAILDGNTMSGAYLFHVKINGRGGHGSRPDLSVSPIECFTAVYAALMGGRMRKVSPFDMFTLSICSVNAGNTHNVIPDELRFAGSCRYLNTETGKWFKQFLAETLDRICPLYECGWEIEKESGPALPVYNDPACAAAGREAVAALFGGACLETVEPWMASETFAETLAIWPGFFALVGIRSEEKGTGAAHHNPRFDIDEDALIYGAGTLLAYTLKVLA